MPPSVASVGIRWLIRWEVCFLVLALLPSQSAATTWISEEDEIAARDASVAVNLFCAGGFKGELDREGGRDTLLAASGGNFILEALQSSSTSDDTGTKVVEQVQTRAGGAAGGILFAVILLVAWSVCCWTACPCCACCRVCSGRRKTSSLIKGILIAAGVGLAFGLIFAASYALTHYGRVVDGFDNMVCTAASLVNGTLGGQTEPYFIGMMPLLTIFKQMDDNLGPNGGFMTGFRAQIDSTADISASVALTSQTLTLLQDTFNNMPPEIAAKKHRCRFCEEVSPIVGEAAVALSGSVGAALDGTRREVDAQLSPEASMELQKALSEAAKPLNDLKKSVREVFSVFTKPDNVLEIRGHLDGDDGPQTAKIPLVIILLLSLIVALLTLFTVIWFCVRETTGSTEQTDEQCNRYPRYSKVTHRSACCTWWCCGWDLAILVFFLSGIIAIVSMVLSSTCLILVDFDEPMLRSIAPALGMDLNGAGGEQLVSIINQCFVPSDPASNPALLDILTTRDNASAPKITMRQKIVGQVTDQLDSQFEALDTKLQSGSQSIAKSEGIVSLIRMLATPVDMLIIADPDGAWESDADYRDLFTQPSLRDAFFSSVRCPDGVVGPQVPKLGNQTILGVANFASKLAAYGTPVPTRPDCAKTVVCTPAAGAAEVAACRSGNKYVTLKQELRDLTNFPCNVFLDPADNVSDCDPLSMTGTFSPAANRTVYTSTCMYPDGTMRRKNKTCDLAGFVTYLTNFGERINKTMTRLDTTVAEVGWGISVGLKSLVQTNIVAPIETIASGVTCGFMGRYYREVIDGLCFQGAVGLTGIGHSYVACGVLAVFVLVLMYGVWRRAIDNVNENVKLQASG